MKLVILLFLISLHVTDSAGHGTPLRGQVLEGMYIHKRSALLG